MLICNRVHWTLILTSSYSKTFDRPHEYDKSPFLIIYSLESVSKNLRICGQKRRLHVDARYKRVQNEISVFENIRIRVDGDQVTITTYNQMKYGWIYQYTVNETN